MAYRNAYNRNLAIGVLYNVSLSRQPFVRGSEKNSHLRVSFCLRSDDSEQPLLFRPTFLGKFSNEEGWDWGYQQELFKSSVVKLFCAYNFLNFVTSSLCKKEPTELASSVFTFIFSTI